MPPRSARGRHARPPRPLRRRVLPRPLPSVRPPTARRRRTARIDPTGAAPAAIPAPRRPLAARAARCRRTPLRRNRRNRPRHRATSAGSPAGIRRGHRGRPQSRFPAPAAAAARCRPSHANHRQQTRASRTGRQRAVAVSTSKVRALPPSNRCFAVDRAGRFLPALGGDRLFPKPAGDAAGADRACPGALPLSSRLRCECWPPTSRAGSTVTARACCAASRPAWGRAAERTDRRSAVEDRRRRLPGSGFALVGPCSSSRSACH